MKKLLGLFAVLLLGGCAVGNQYSYQTSDVNLPLRSASGETVVLQVRDLRPYVLNGDKTPDFVGLQRGGFGNPFDVKTESGKPLTEAMAVVVADGLKEAGYQVVNVPDKQDMDALVKAAANEDASKIIVLKVMEWKSDIYMGITLHSDMILSVYIPDGKLRAESTSQFVRQIGGAQIGAEKNSELVTGEFAKQIGYLFNEESVRKSLQ